MGTSTDAILAYGYDLAGGEGDWKVKEVDEDGELAVDWYDPDSGDDFVTQAEDRLLAEAGFVETDWQVDGYFRRRSAAAHRLGVEFTTYCHHEYSMWILAARIITVHRGDCKVLDLPGLDREATEQGWDAKLDAAMKVLGLTPKQQAPGWLLCSYWG